MFTMLYYCKDHIVSPAPQALGLPSTLTWLLFHNGIKDVLYTPVHGLWQKITYLNSDAFLCQEIEAGRIYLGTLKVSLPSKLIFLLK